MLLCSSDVRSVDAEPEPGIIIVFKLLTYISKECNYLEMYLLTIFEGVFADSLRAILCRATVSASVADADADADNVAVAADDIVAGTHCFPRSIHRHYFGQFVQFDRMICCQISLATPDPASLRVL